MNAPSSPKRYTWIIGVILGALGIIGHYAYVQILSEYNYWLLLVGFLVLAAGTTFREILRLVCLWQRIYLQHKLV